MPATPVPPQEPRPPVEDDVIYREHDLGHGHRLRTRSRISAVSRAMARSYGTLAPAPAAAAAPQAPRPDPATTATTGATGTTGTTSGAIRDPATGRWLSPASAVEKAKATRIPGLPKKTNWEAVSAAQVASDLDVSPAVAVAAWREAADAKAVEEERLRKEADRRGERLSWRPANARKQTLDQEAAARKAEADRFDAYLQERLAENKRHF